MRFCIYFPIVFYTFISYTILYVLLPQINELKRISVTEITIKRNYCRRNGDFRRCRDVALLRVDAASLKRVDKPFKREFERNVQIFV